jgi:hypothetical protein
MSYLQSVRIVALSVVICCVGCGKPAAPSVKGKVTLDGESVANGGIVFLPLDKGGSKAAAAIEQGAYAISPEDKLVPGKYRVEISWRKPTGKKIASADPGITMDETREAVPAKFNTDSTLTADIGGGEVVKDFELKSQ